MHIAAQMLFFILLTASDIRKTNDCTMNISFDNTENAFAYKTDKELKQSKFLFNTMDYPLFVPIGTRLTPFLMKTGLPVHGIIRNTIFKQFVGGETLAETSEVAATLGQYGVQVILDYGVEGKEGDENFEHAADVFIDVINFRLFILFVSLVFLIPEAISTSAFFSPSTICTPTFLCSMTRTPSAR